MKRKIFFAVIVLFFIAGLASFSLAQGLEIVREARNQVSMGEPLEVKISVLNQEANPKKVKISERISENFELISPKEPTSRKSYNGLEVSFLDWTLDIPEKSSVSVSYTINPAQPGDVSLAPTQVVDSSSGAVYSGDILQLNVKCAPNNLCEQGENYLSCPEDCPTGSKDGVCDYVADKICDPDCTDDPDCSLFERISPLTFIIPVVLIVLLLIAVKIFKSR